MPRSTSGGRGSEARAITTGPLQEDLALAAVRRGGADHLSVGDQVERVDVLAELAGLGVPEPHPVADPQLAPRRRSAGSAPRRRPRRGTSASPAATPASAAGRARPRPDAIQPPPRTVACRGEGRAYDGQHEVGGRLRAEPRVVVEEVRPEQPRACGDLGDRGLGGGGLDAAGAAAVDELERCHARGPRRPLPRGARPARGRTAAASRGRRTSAARAGCRRPRRSGPRRPSARPARTAGARRSSAPARPPPPARARRAAGAEVDPAAREPQRSVELEAHPDRRPAGDRWPLRSARAARRCRSSA